MADGSPLRRADAGEAPGHQRSGHHGASPRHRADHDDVQHRQRRHPARIALRRVGSHAPYGATNPSQSDDDFDVSLHDYSDWRDRQKVFDGLSAFQNTSVVISGGGGTAEQYRGARMSANTLAQLRGERRDSGRDFGPADEAPGAPAVVLISHRVWESRFGSDPAAVGRVLRVNGAPAEIVGVMPPRFAFPGQPGRVAAAQISTAGHARRRAARSRSSDA